MLLAFGFVFLVWGIRRAVRHRPHSHVHVHADGTMHKHPHVHKHGHVHVHEHVRSMTPWWIFVIFVFGPCEPLIPLLMYPAAQGGFAHVLVVATLFSFATIATMLAAVAAGVFGLRHVHWTGFERYAHALAGFIILLSGLAVVAGL
jgi:hypothetical protein